MDPTGPSWKLLLPSLEAVFAPTSVCVVSFGVQELGKSAFLNFLLSKEEENNGPADFTRNTFRRKADRGVEVIPRVKVFFQGTLTPSLNVFDFQLDMEQDRGTIENTLAIFPPSQTVVLVHLQSGDDLMQQYSTARAIIETVPSHAAFKLVFLIRDSSEIPNEISAELKEDCFAIDRLDSSLMPDLMPVRDRVFELVRELIKPTPGIEWALSSVSRQLLSAPLAREDPKIREARKLLEAVRSPGEVLKLNAIAKRICEINQAITQLDSESRQSSVRNDRLAQIRQLVQEKAHQESNRVCQRHRLVEIYEEIFCSGDKRLLRAFETETELWTDRQTKEIAKEYKRLKNELAPDSKERVDDEKRKQVELLVDEEIGQDQRKQLELLACKLDSMSMTRALFLREISTFYTHEAQAPTPAANTFFGAMASFVQRGGSLEIIDGMVSELAEAQLRRVLTAYQSLQGGHGRRPVVISVIGPQSSGKSTLLNFLFRSNFEASAGRCTQGMFCSLMRTDVPGADLALILDTEGLLSIEKNNPRFDRQITTLVMALADVLIVNIKGEINQSMKDILSISLLSAQQLDKAKLKRGPVIYFVLRDMASTDLKEMQEAIHSITATMKDISSHLGVPSLEESKFVVYRGQDSFILVHDAFNSYAHLTSQPNSPLKVPLFSMQNVSGFFRNETVSLLTEIFQAANMTPIAAHAADTTCSGLQQFVDDVSATWRSIAFCNVTTLGDLKEKADRGRLQGLVREIVTGLSKSLRKRIDEVEKEADDYEKSTSNVSELESKTVSDVSELERKVRDIEKEFQQTATTDFDCKIRDDDHEKLKSEYREVLMDSVTGKLEPTRMRLKLIQTYGPWAAMMRAMKQKLRNKVNDSVKELVTGSIVSVQMIPQKVAELKTEVEDVVRELERNLLELIRKTPYNKRSLELVKAAAKNQSSSYKKDEAAFVLNPTHVEKGSELITRFQSNDDRQDGYMIDRALYDRTLLGKTMNVQSKNGMKLALPNGLTELDFLQYLSQAICVSRVDFVNEFNRAQTQRSTDNIVAHIWSSVTSKFQRESVEDREAKLAGKETKIADGISRLQLTYGSLVLEKFCQVIDDIVFAQVSEQQLETVLTEVQHALKDIGKPLNAQLCSVKRDRFLVSLAVVLIKSIETYLQTQDQQKTTGFLNEMNSEGAGMVTEFETKLTAACGGAMAAAAAKQMQAKMIRFQKDSVTHKLVEFCRRGFETTPLELASRANEIVYKSDAKANDIISFAKSLNLYQEAIYNKMFQESLDAKRQEVGHDAASKHEANKATLIKRLQRLQELCAQAVLDNKTANNLFIAWLCDPIQLQTFSQFTFSREDTSFVPPYNEEELLGSKFFARNGIPDLYAFLQSLVPLMEKNPEDVDLLSYAMTVPMEPSLNAISKKQSLGCPDCGAKCDRTGPHTSHMVEKHRVMGLRGSFSQEASAPQLLSYVCGEAFILNESKWNKLENPSGLDTTPKNREVIDVRKRELLTSRGAKSGELEFVLEWKDPNDLDLFVTCPCDARLGLGSECQACGRTNSK